MRKNLKNATEEKIREFDEFLKKKITSDKKIRHSLFTFRKAVKISLLFDGVFHKKVQL